ncbi:MAG: recombinase family protein [Pseudomonadota bacterium]
MRTDNLNARTKAIAYVRSSTAQHVVDSEQICFQTQRIIEYAKSNSFKLENVYTDSGCIDDNLFARETMLFDLSQRSDTNELVLLVDDISNLGRNLSVNLDIRDKIHQCGVEIIVIGMEDLNKETADLVMRMRIAHTEYEDNLVEEVISIQED